MSQLPLFIYVKIDNDPTIHYMSLQSLMLLFVTYANDQHIDIFHINLVSDLIYGFKTKQMVITIGKHNLYISSDKERIQYWLIQS